MPAPPPARCPSSPPRPPPGRCRERSPVAPRPDGPVPVRSAVRGTDGVRDTARRAPAGCAPAAPRRRLARDLHRPPGIEEGERAAKREVVAAPQALPGDLRRPGEGVEDARHVRDLTAWTDHPRV